MATPSQSPWTNSNTPGAVQDPDSDSANTSNQQSGSNTDGQDAIREGKQKAKETMQANMSNGAPQLSRKRSRDGTQLPATHSSASSDGADESRTAHDQVLLDRYVQRDLLHSAAMNDQSERSRALVIAKEKEKDFYVNAVGARRKQDPGSIYGYGFMGYGNGTTNARSQIVYSSNRGPIKGRRSRQLHIPRKDNAQQADHHEELVPIRLDIELDKLRLRDTFTWNLHEKVISQDQFTDYLLEDLKIPNEAVPEVGRQVKAEMQEQISNFYPHIIVEDGPLEPGRPYSDHKDDEMRIQIKLNITIGRITLIDQFEWDINSPLNSPEEFARQMAWENALSGEFTTAIAHTIREQSQLYTKSLYLTNHCFDGRPVEDPELKDSFLPGPVHSAFRPPHTQKDWTPYLYEMSEAELERTETSMMREHRAQKRQLNRRGGPALPDLKERQRTVRSLLVHTVLPGAVETFETTGILKTRRGGRSARRGGRNDVDVDSEDLDSEESGADSPAPSTVANTVGTARTRGMRGAAAQAQMNMRANFNRSATPDSQLLSAPHPEPRTSARRSHLREEESVADDSDQLIVKLKISKAKYKAWWDSYQAKKRASAFPLSGYASQPPPSNANLAVGTPTRGGTSTPSMTPRALPQARGTPQPNGNHSRAQSTTRSSANIQYDARGAVEIETWPAPDDTPPQPPPWLLTAIETLRDRHPDDIFTPVMKPYMLDLSTNTNTPNSRAAPGEKAPPGFVFKFMPRIRCHDCPLKVYTAQPDRTVQDFEVHLRNRKHRDQVEKRIGEGR